MGRLTVRELEILIKETVSNMNSSTILNGIKPEFLRGRMAQLMEYLTDYTIATYKKEGAQ